MAMRPCDSTIRKGHAMSRIEADHLVREAIVYVRQSTADQVNNNVEVADPNIDWSSRPGSSARPTSASSARLCYPVAPGLP